MSHGTMTTREILEAHSALEILSGRGYKSAEASKKIARMFRWARKHQEAFVEARKLLIEGHAIKEDGKKVPRREKSQETGEWQDVEGTVTFEDQEAFDDEVKKLLDEENPTNGVQLTDTDFKSCKVKPEPGVYVGLGPLYDWGDDENKDDEGDDEE